MTDNEAVVQELLGEKTTISKLEAAKRQLDAAVLMFFFNGDAASMHTLASAAHEILRDICHARKLKTSTMSALLKDPAMRKAFNAIRIPQDFFKHARKDPEGKLNFWPGITTLYLFESIRMYLVLSEDLTYEMKVFLMWLQLKYPDLLRFPPAEEDLAQLRNSAKTPEAFKLLGRQLLIDKRKPSFEKLLAASGSG